MLTDFILLIAPLPTLWRLQMPGETKLQLIGIFCIGGFVCIVSIYRIPQLHGLSLVDASWSNASTTIWSLVEICVAVVCACAITYRPLVNWIFRIRISIIDRRETSNASQSMSRSGPHQGTDNSNKSAPRGGMLKMENMKLFEKQRGPCVVKESAVKSEDRSSFHQLVEEPQ